MPVTTHPRGQCLPYCWMYLDKSCSSGLLVLRSSHQWHSQHAVNQRCDFFKIVRALLAGLIKVLELRNDVPSQATALLANSESNKEPERAWEPEGARESQRARGSQREPEWARLWLTLALSGSLWLSQAFSAHTSSMPQNCFVEKQLNTTLFCRETLKYGTFCRETIKYALRGNNSEWSQVPRKLAN